MAAVLPGLMAVLDDVTVNTSHGSTSTLPPTVSQPLCPGPALQPHQLFSPLTLPVPVRFTPVLSTIRLK